MRLIPARVLPSRESKTNDADSSRGRDRPRRHGHGRRPVAGPERFRSSRLRRTSRSRAEDGGCWCTACRLAGGARRCRGCADRPRGECAANRSRPVWRARRGSPHAARSHRHRQCDGLTRVRRSAGCTAEGRRPAADRRAGVGRRRQGRTGRNVRHGVRRSVRIRPLRGSVQGHLRQALSPGRRARSGFQGEDDQPAARRCAHRRRCRGRGPGAARGLQPARAVRGHHQQRGRLVDVPEPRTPHPCRRLHTPVGGQHLRQGPGHRSRLRQEERISPSPLGHCTPDVHAGLGGRPRRQATAARTIRRS